ncbi:single-stranded DNA-binding protein [Cupriavidus pauculus]|uniref:single-stranded DNA-binding protein n=1 Tax=Cupriavidus pauculus TaxID=82633 RepID=UPI00385756F4
MSSSVNKLILKGRLGKDPVTRYLPSGDQVTTFSLATHEGTHTEWHAIYAYREWSEIASSFKTGDVVWFEGRIKTRTFQSEGYEKPRSVRELVASFVSLVTPKSISNGEHETIPSAGEMPPADFRDAELLAEDAGFNVPNWL